MRRIVLLLIGLFALTLMGLEAQAEDVQVTIDLTQEVGEINPYVYGMGHGPWAGVSGQMREEATETGMTFLRWPGGNWGDLNNITRPQLDLYVLEARSWNAEPSIHVRIIDGTPEQAAELVRYANIEKGYNIRYWAIGNEPTLPSTGFTIESFSNQWREIAIAMEAVDPNIILIGPETHQYADTYESSYLDDMRDWVRGFLEINGDMVDIVSVHRYPFPIDQGGTLTTISMMRENVPNWATLVEILRADIRDTVGHDLPIAITEVNSHWNNTSFGEATNDSYYNAIWWSGTLSTLIRERVDIVAYFILSTVETPYGILSRYNPRPTYYTYQLFRDFGTMQVASESSDEYVTVVAAQREDGAITLIITNLYEEARSVTLDLSGTAISEVSEMRVLAPELLAETVDPTTYFDGTVLEMPAQSAIRLVITVDS